MSAFQITSIIGVLLAVLFVTIVLLAFARPDRGLLALAALGAEPRGGEQPRPRHDGRRRTRAGRRRGLLVTQAAASDHGTAWSTSTVQW
jgi:hypothetical protein